MPLVFSKIALNTFLLFLIPILLVLVLPALLGFLGGLSGLELKSKNLKPANNELIKKISVFEGCKISGGLISFFKKVIQQLKFKHKSQLIKREDKAYKENIVVCFSFFCIFIFLGILSILNKLLGILLFSFVLFLVLEFIILICFIKKENIEINRLSYYIIPLAFPTIGGFLSGFVYIISFAQFIFNKNDDYLLIIIFLMAPLISSFSFWVTLKNNNIITRIFVGVIVLLIFMIYPRVLFWPNFVNEYFQWNRYGNIPVQIISESNGKCRPKIADGLILFNSGSELYIRMKTNKSYQVFPTICLSKESKGLISEIILEKDQIIQIPYGKLKTLPSF